MLAHQNLTRFFLKGEYDLGMLYSSGENIERCDILFQ
jgi:hypothetical protein